LQIENDNDILREFTSGNIEPAATALVHKYRKFVWSSAMRYLGSYDDADDAAQEVFIRAIENLHKFRAESSIKTWLYRITVNICTNMIRRKKLKFWVQDDTRDDKYERPDLSPTPAQRFENQDFERRFSEMLQKLPAKQRETFALRYFDELSYDEISTMLGTSVGGLKANYFQAVRKLAELIKNDGTFE
jgi:RNA polymerase sigma-70 factor (ECF subfamily)